MGGQGQQEGKRIVRIDDLIQGKSGMLRQGVCPEQVGLDGDLVDSPALSLGYSRELAQADELGQGRAVPPFVAMQHDQPAQSLPLGQIGPVEQVAQLAGIDLRVAVLVNQSDEGGPASNRTVRNRVHETKGPLKGSRGLLCGEYLKVEFRALLGAAVHRAQESHDVTRFDPFVEQGYCAGFQRGARRRSLGFG